MARLVDPSTIAGLVSSPALYDFIDGWTFDAERGIAEYVRGAGQRLDLLVRGRYAWRREGDGFGLSLEDITLHNPYAETKVGELPPQVSACRLEEGPFVMRQQVVWRVPDRAAWPCLRYPWRLAFERHPVPSAILSEATWGNLASHLSALPGPDAVTRYYAPEVGEEVTADALVAAGHHRRALLVADQVERGPAGTSSPFGFRGLGARLQRRLEGRMWTTMVASGPDEIEAAVTELRAIGVDEVLVTSLHTVRSPAIDSMLRSMRSTARYRLGPRVPVTVCDPPSPAALGRGLMRSLRPLRPQGADGTHLLLLREPGEIDDAAVATATAVASNLPADAVCVCVVPSEGGARVIADALSRLDARDAGSVVLMWLSPLAPSGSQLEAVRAGLQRYEGALKIDIGMPGIALDGMASILAG